MSTTPPPPKFKLYNSLTRQKQEFEPLDPSHVRLYACGPTVYSYAHIGNARMAVTFDQLARVLRFLYPRVTYVSNITDVDDRIIQAAIDTGREIGEITRFFEEAYNQDMAILGVTPPDIQPRATEHIVEMIALIQSLIAKNHAYEVNGHVLFHVPSFAGYGGLSGRSRDDQIAGARVEVAPFKKDPADFVLWKPSTPDQPGWESPWGYGRPGWHIECSAMAETHLGLPIDIHGGGADLKFPHHENEIAQSCCAHDQTDLAAFSRYWMHNGFLTVNGEKMSKSLGNFTLTHDVIARGIAGEAIRHAFLSAHYRQPLDWSEETLARSQKTLDKFYRVVADLTDKEHLKITDTAVPPPEFLEALCDDLNTPKAYAVLNALAKKATVEKTAAALSDFVASARFMGFLIQSPAQWFAQNTAAGNDGSSDLDASEIEALLSERTVARAAKNFTRSDEIRDELLSHGITIIDTPQGPEWRKSH